MRDDAPPDGPSATAVMRPASGSQAHGTVKFTQVGTRVRVDAEIAALSPGIARHPRSRKGRLHRARRRQRRPAFQPGGKKHGAPESAERHAGDLGNLTANEYGKATVSIMVDGISVGKGADGVIGRGVIVHADPDDLKTDPAGNSGDRIGCGVVEG